MNPECVYTHPIDEACGHQHLSAVSHLGHLDSRSGYLPDGISFSSTAGGSRGFVRDVEFGKFGVTPCA